MIDSAVRLGDPLGSAPPPIQDLLWQLLPIFAVLVVVASLLALARRWVRPHDPDLHIWLKYPAFLLLAGAFIFALWLPPQLHALPLLLGLIALFCARDLNRALGAGRFEGNALALGAAGLTAATEFLTFSDWSKVWLTSVLVAIVIASLTNPRERLGTRIVGVCACLGLFPWCLGLIDWLRQTSGGDFLALNLYLVVATNDAFSQILGQLIGKRTFGGTISPRKTWEGFAGGVIFATLASAAMFAVVGWSATSGAWIGGIVAIAGSIGDLCVSAWKRFLGLKDFGALLGPHGGALDRFDSLIFAAPALFLILAR